MANPRQQLPTAIRQQLSRLRMQIRSYVLAEGVGMSIAWIGFAFWVGLAVDYLPVRMGANEMPRGARLVLLALALIGLGYIVFRYIVRRLFVPFDDRNLALLLEKRFPQFQDSLITAVDTTVSADAPDTQLFDSMLDQAVTTAADQSKKIETAEVFNRRPLFRAMTGAAIAVASIGLFAIFSNAMFSTWTSRFLLASDDAWPRQSQIEILGFPDGNTKTVAEGSNVVIQVRADAKKRLPETCVISYRSDSGNRGRIRMSRDGELRDGFQHYQYEGPPFDAMSSPLEFDVTGFDHRLSDLRLRVVPSPTVSEIELACQLPDYMDLPVRKLTWRPGLALPVGTRIELKAKANKPLKNARIEDPTTGDVVQVNSASDGGESTILYQLPTLTASTKLKITLQDTDGISSEEPYELAINAVQDLPPQLDIRLNGIGNAITPDARLPAFGEIKDDYRVNEGWFQVTVPERNEEHRVLLQKNLAGDIEETLDLRRHRTADEDAWELKPGDKISFDVRATDYFDLTEEPRLGVSDSLPLLVVTPDELLAILEAREEGLKQRYEQILRELRDTRDQLLRLQAELESDEEIEGESGSSPSESDDAVVLNSPEMMLRRIIVQRAAQQGAKSEQEVRGVAFSFSDIREELVNNRIDTPERNERLKRQIVDPLEQIVDDQFPLWLETLRELDEGIAAPEAAATTAVTVEQANNIIFALEQVLENMLELETFNELVQLVRSILEEQEALQEKTRKEQKRQDRDALFD